VNLSVRNRIVIALSLVLAASIAAGIYATWAYARAASYAEQARTATERATLAALAGQQVTRFFSEASNLALGVARAQESAEQSADYGGVNGTDLAASRTIERLADAAGDDTLRSDWAELRMDVYHWINAEAEAGGAALRMRQREDGRFYASTTSNLEPSDAVAGLQGVELRRKVRERQDAYLDGELRAIARQADTVAASAVRAEAEAKEAARLGTLVLIGLSIIVAVSASVWLYRSIATPLARAREFASAVKGGDLGARLEQHQHDEIGELTMAVEEMKDSVVARIDTMREVAGVVLVLTEHLGESLVHAERVAADQAADPELVSDLADARKDSAALAGMVGQLLEA